MSNDFEFTDKYPEHAKMEPLQAQSQVIGEFLEWLQTDYTICSWDENEETFFQVRLDMYALLAKYFDIDLRKLENEKREMIRAMKGGSK